MASTGKINPTGGCLVSTKVPALFPRLLERSPLGNDSHRYVGVDARARGTLEIHSPI